ncbi:MAG TPA: M1 family aminopeptidase [Vicinamibacteria bacterium]|nr:M1 family aminopeptidase [Vicinamibacteria bacterium]
MRARWPRTAALLVLALVPRRSTPAPPPPDPKALLDRLEAAWAARDVAGYLSLWDPARGEELAQEKEQATIHFNAEQSLLQLQRPPVTEGAESLHADAQVFTVTEPRARVEQWRLQLEKREAGWVFTGREDQGQVEGLVHLSLDPTGYRSDGLTLHLEDFELKMIRGTLFMSPPLLGPTVLVFVGEGEVRVSPRPPAEQEQLRHFCGQRELKEKVRAAFVRLHPAGLHRILDAPQLELDPGAKERWDEAQRFYRDQVQRAFVLDTTLPRSPWWLLPSLGDVVVTFATRKHGTLTLTNSSGDPEDISLFDRARHLQICTYPSGGRSTRYSEDDNQAVDILHHDLRVRFDPERYGISAEDTVRLRVLVPTSNLRLRLDDAFQVASVTSREGGNHLFFRVRDQGSLVVSLGPLSGVLGEVALTVRYAGIHNPAPIDQELLQTGKPTADTEEQNVRIETAVVYTNRTAWYPRNNNDNYARARLRFDVPVGFSVVTGGERVSARVEGARTRLEYRQEQPGKYITAAVGRFDDVGMRQDGDLVVRGFGLPRTRGIARELLPLAQDILRFFAEEFGPCPYSFLNLAVLEGQTPGGHSPPGMVLMQDRPSFLLKHGLRDDPANFSDVPGFFLAHELAHQWWGQGVAGQNYRERWLSEGAAQYAAALWVRRSRGEEAFRALLARIGRWALHHSAQGPINLGHRLGHLQGDPQIYRAVVYDKGAYVLHMLRAIVGDEVFSRAMRQFQAQHRYAKAGTDDLREALETASGKNLEPYFREWVYGTALPVLQVSHRTEKTARGFRTTIEVRPRNLPGPVPLQIGVTHEGGRESLTVTLSPEGGSWTVESASAPRRVEVNSDLTLLVQLERG